MIIFQNILNKFDFVVPSPQGRCRWRMQESGCRRWRQEVDAGVDAGGGCRGGGTQGAPSARGRRLGPQVAGDRGGDRGHRSARARGAAGGPAESRRGTTVVEAGAAGLLVKGATTQQRGESWEEAHEALAIAGQQSMRYAGSIMRIDAGERDQQKSQAGS